MDTRNTILTQLLEHGKKVSYRNQLQGYGLNDSAFEKLEKGISRRQFSHHKFKLLKSNFIARLRYADKRIQYFTITPLGIIHLLNKIENLDKLKFRKILEIINLFSSVPHKQHLFDSKLFGRLIKIKPTLARECLFNAIQSVKIEPSHKRTLVYAMDPIAYDLTTVYLQYSIDSSIYRHRDFFNFDSKKKIPITDFYHGIATHIFRHFHMQLFHRLKDTSIPKFYHEQIFSIVYPHVSIMREQLLQVIRELEDSGIEMDFGLKVKSLNFPDWKSFVK